MREIERVMKLRCPIKEADLLRYLVPWAQSLAQLLRNKGQPVTESVIIERLEISSNVLGIALYTAEQKLEAQFNAAAALALKHPKLDKADALGARLQLSFADRTLLKIRTIGACDVTKTQRIRLRRVGKRARDRQRRAMQRAEQGAIPREQWLAQSKSRTQPWETEGVSRATYYRRLKKPPRMR